MSSMTGTTVFLQNNPPIQGDQRRAILLGANQEAGAPPSYEEAINPNGRLSPYHLFR